MAALAPLTDAAAVEAILGRTGLPVDRLNVLISAASAAFRAETGQTVSLVEDDVVELDSNGASVLLLPAYPVTAVTAVVIDGEPQSVADFEWSRKGILRRRGGWPAGYRKVIVTYSHGYAEVPADVAAAVAEAVAVRLNTQPGRTSVTLGAFSASFAAGATQTWADTIRRYRA